MKGELVKPQSDVKKRGLDISNDEANKKFKPSKTSTPTRQISSDNNSTSSGWSSGTLSDSASASGDISSNKKFFIAINDIDTTTSLVNVSGVVSTRDEYCFNLKDASGSIKVMAKKLHPKVGFMVMAYNMKVSRVTNPRVNTTNHLYYLEETANTSYKSRAQTSFMPLWQVKSSKVEKKDFSVKGKCNEKSETLKGENQYGEYTYKWYKLMSIEEEEGDFYAIGECFLIMFNNQPTARELTVGKKYLITGCVVRQLTIRGISQNGLNITSQSVITEID